MMLTHHAGVLQLYGGGALRLFAFFWEVYCGGDL
jgi:hypothetical protein